MNWVSFETRGQVVSVYMTKMAATKMDPTATRALLTNELGVAILAAFGSPDMLVKEMVGSRLKRSLKLNDEVV